MSSCEKCWADARSRHYGEPSKSLVDHYHDLLQERKGNPCTPEEQAGDNPGLPLGYEGVEVVE